MFPFTHSFYCTSVQRDPCLPLSQVCTFYFPCLFSLNLWLRVKGRGCCTLFSSMKHIVIFEYELYASNLIDFQTPEPSASWRRSEVSIMFEDNPLGLMSVPDIFKIYYSFYGWMISIVRLHFWAATHSPSPAEDEGVLDGHQWSQLRTLGVMVLATFLAPCEHTSHLSSQPAGHTHTHTHTHK